MEDSLEKALEKTFRNTGVLWRLKRKYVILEQAPAVEVRDSIAGNTTEAVERRDTITESRISTDRYRREVNRTQTGLEHIDGGKFNSGFAFLRTVCRCIM